MSTNTGIGLESNARMALVERYSAWEARLCENIATLARQRSTFNRIFFGGLVASVLGFYFGAWFGVGSVATGIAWCGTGLYLMIVRGRQYREELSRTRAELRRLAGEGG
jgi:hypothetical protein